MIQPGDLYSEMIIKYHNLKVDEKEILTLLAPLADILEFKVYTTRLRIFEKPEEK